MLWEGEAARRNVIVAWLRERWELEIFGSELWCD